MAHYQGDEKNAVTREFHVKKFGELVQKVNIIIE